MCDKYFITLKSDAIELLVVLVLYDNNSEIPLQCFIITNTATVKNSVWSLHWKMVRIIVTKSMNNWI